MLCIKHTAHVIGMIPRAGAPGDAAAGGDAWNAFDAMVDSWADEDGAQPKGRPPNQQVIEEEEEDDAAPRVLCARCYSLTHYG